MNAHPTLLLLAALTVGCVAEAPTAGAEPVDVEGSSAPLDEADPRVLGRGELGCDAAGPALVPLGPWDATYDLAAERTDGCRGRLGLSRGAVLAEVIDPEPRMYGAAMGATLADGTRVVCANIVDAWATDETLEDGELVYRVARVSIACATSSRAGWSPLRRVVDTGPDAAWLQEVSVEDGRLVVGFLRDSRVAYQDLNGAGRPDSDGACHAALRIARDGALVADAVVHDEGYPWGASQALPE